MTVLSSKTVISFHKKLFAFALAVIAAAWGFSSAFALEDGVYTVGRTTSYVNPETGVTEDGGTNIALGDSMCESIVEKEALVEVENGNTYVTLGIGLMSNISSVKFKIQGDDGSYRLADSTVTGSCERDGDICSHYRFKVDSPENLISPVLYVTPMGREVQFFVKLDLGSAEPGTGNFAALSGENSGEEESKEPQTSLTEEKTENTSVSEEKTEEAFSAENISENNKDKADGESKDKGEQMNFLYIIILLVLLAAVTVFIFARKKRN